MNYSRQIYRDIQRAFVQLYPPKTLNGHQIRHLYTSIAMISGIIQSCSSQLGKIASKIPENIQHESLVKRFSRLLQNEEVSQELFFLPFVMPLLHALASSGPIVLAIDGSETGRHCMTLMVSVIYKKRSIPIAWLVKEGNKGHMSEEIHLELLEIVKGIIPDHAKVIFLGDGEFDGTAFQEQITQQGWGYVLRTAKNSIIYDGDDRFSLKTVAISSGELFEIPHIAFTDKQYGPVTVLIWWDKQYDDPIYLVTNMDCSEEACHYYRRRYRIETFFSDQKSRGFNLQKSHLSDPSRISRLLIASCLAYIWMIFLGEFVKPKPEIMKQIHRVDRCDLSLFQIGLRYFEYLCKNGDELPIILCPV